MTTQTIDGITFKMQEEYDFGFLSGYGRVFKVFEEQDSGNICFGVKGENGKLFIKFAGAKTAEYDGRPEDAVQRLKAAVHLYKALAHPSLIHLRDATEIGGGHAAIFDWADGECMGRMYEDSHRRIMALTVEEKTKIFSSVIDFLKFTAAQGYQAIDFYYGSIMYDTVSGKTTICDIDYFRKQPAFNDMGRMWGSSRFLSPEEYEKGAALDEVTNVFTLGQMGFSLFTDSDRSQDVFPLTAGCFEVLMKAISPEREKRYRSVAEFEENWKREIKRR